MTNDWTAGPIGARRARLVLVNAGIVLSEATASRLLTRLDAAGLTQSVRSQGRTLTDHGRRRVESFQTQERRLALVNGAFSIGGLQDVLDLLHARRAVEVEAVRAAALRIGPRDLRRLDAILDSAAQRLATNASAQQESIAFHCTLGQLCGNRLLAAMTQLVFDRSLEPAETLLDLVVGTHHSEGEALDEHRQILDALRDKDPESAATAMAVHIDRLVSEVTTSMAAGGSEVFDRMLAWMSATNNSSPAPIRIESDRRING